MSSPSGSSPRHIFSRRTSCHGNGERSSSSRSAECSNDLGSWAAMVRRDELTAGENSTLRHSTQTRDSLGLCPFATAFRLSTGLLPQSVSNNSASRMAVQILSWLQWGRDQMIAEIAPLYPISFQRSAARFASGWAVATGTIQCLATSCHQTPGIQSPYMLRAAPGLSPPPHRSRAKSCRGEKFHLAAF